MLADGFDMVFDPLKSRGTSLYDSKNQKAYLDLFSFYASMPLSFHHPKLSDPQYLEKLLRVAQLKPSNPDVYTVELAEFVDTFGRIATAGRFQYHFFIEGGALGVENALKIAFDWKAHKNMARGKEVGKQAVIHFTEAFHGRSGYTVSLTNTYDPRKYQYFPKFDWPRVLNPKMRFPMTQDVTLDVAAKEQESLRAIDEIIHRNPDDVACLIIEPIQAEGGDNHFRPEFLRELRKRADEHDFLLIFDEVQTGGGLCGSMWAHDLLGVKPDIISFGKKFQIAGCASTTRIDDIPNHVFKVGSRINSTYGGNLTDMVRCQRYLEIIDEEKLIENAKNVGEFILSNLRDLSAKYPRLSNVRGRGLMIAFDLPDNTLRDAFKQEMKEQGALVIPCGPQSIRLRPVLDFSQADASTALSMIETTMKKLA